MVACASRFAADEKQLVIVFTYPAVKYIRFSPVSLRIEVKGRRITERRADNEDSP